MPDQLLVQRIRALDDMIAAAHRADGRRDLRENVLQISGEIFGLGVIGSIAAINCRGRELIRATSLNGGFGAETRCHSVDDLDHADGSAITTEYPACHCVSTTVHFVFTMAAGLKRVLSLECLQLSWLGSE